VDTVLQMGGVPLLNAQGKKRGRDQEVPTRLRVQYLAPNADALAVQKQCIILPLFPQVRDGEQASVAAALKLIEVKRVELLSAAGAKGERHG
jgi:hypothetical protein